MISKFQARSRWKFSHGRASKFANALTRASQNGKRAETRLANAREKLSRLKFAPAPRMRKGYSGDYRFTHEQAMQKERDAEIAELEKKVKRAEKHVQRWEKLVELYRDKMMENIETMTTLKKTIDA